MESSRLIPVCDYYEWKAIMSRCGQYSIYHIPEYYLLARSQGEGEPYLFYFQNEDGEAAFPLLLRDVSSVSGLEEISFRDATSVYGYPGIICSISCLHPRAPSFRDRFQDHLRSVLQTENVIDLFSRLNPLIPTSWLFEQFGQVIPLSHTVAIDLTISDLDYLKNMTKGHRYDLRKARADGATVREDVDFARLDDFIRMYHETMTRTNAHDYYFFPHDYFRQLKPLFGDAVRLFIAEKDQKVISAALFFTIGNVIQYHLSGTPRDCLSLGGAKLILDCVRIWGKEYGYKWLHLGGGVGSQEDSLFRFKAGFSKLRFPFEIVKIILQPSVYEEVVCIRDSWLARQGLMREKVEYFPQYRAPFVHRAR